MGSSDKRGVYPLNGHFIIGIMTIFFHWNWGIQFSDKPHNKQGLCGKPMEINGYMYIGKELS